MTKKNGMCSAIVHFMMFVWTNGTFGSDPGILTLSNAVKVALENNPQLRAVKYTREAAENEKREALSGFLPHLSFSSEASKLESDRFDETFRSAGFAGITYANSFQLTQLLFDRSVLGNIHLANLRYEAAQWQDTGQEQRVVFETVAAFLDALRDQELVTVQKQRLALAEKQLRTTLSKFDAGFQIMADVSRAQLARSSAKRDVVSAEIALERSQLVLNRLMSTPASRRYQLEAGVLTAHDPSSDRLFDGSSLQAFYSISEEKNPAIQVAGILVRQSEESVNMARGEFLPQLNLSANWGYFDRGSLDLKSEEWSIRGALLVPLYEGGRRFAKVKRAQKELDAEKARYEDAVQNIYNLIEDSVLLLREERRNLETAVEAEEVALKNHRLFVNLYEGGMAESLDVSQALTELVEHQTDVVVTRYGYLHAFAQLLSALGTIPTLGEAYTGAGWLNMQNYYYPDRDESQQQKR